MSGVIAIDTASSAAAWVIRADRAGTVLADARVAGRALDQGLVGAVMTVADGTPEAVVVLTGPGSYSGVRAGMAAALGLALAGGVPLHGYGTLAAVAAVAAVAADDGEPFAVVAAAGRRGVYLARFVRTGVGVAAVGPALRIDAAQMPAAGRRFATAPVEGVDAALVDPVAALAAAVPLALTSPPLEAAGLDAQHATPVEDTPR